MSTAIVRIRESVNKGESMKAAVLREMVRVAEKPKEPVRFVLVTKNEIGVC